MKSREDHDSQDTIRQGEKGMCVLFWRPRTDPGKEAMKPTRLVAGKFSLRCYLPLLLLHISSKETRSVQSWLHTPEKNKTRGARSRREDGKTKPRRNESAYRSPTVSLFELRSGYSARQPKGGKYTRRRAKKPPLSHDQMVRRNP